ncbi:MAG TPA: protein translocase subunit SecDF [Chitinophagales bacterium]|nr:protein translocase subunit SecDF [Chitinophagales bacterium]HRK25802.1 protein translocase subunit SecDF [Chitinophagales bacterium]
MQAKGLIKFFGIALALVCIYQLSFTLMTNWVEGKAGKYAQEAAAKLTNVTEEQKFFEERKAKRRYLDSVSLKPVVNLGFAKFTYQQLKERQINLGLDLQGGMSVVLQVSLQDLIKAMANNNADPVLNQALQKADELQKNSQEDFITLFGRSYTQIDPNAKLAPLFAGSEYQSKINLNSSNDDVLALIREEADASVSRTFEILRSRIDKFGVAQPNINLQQATGRIVVELPGVDDPDRVRRLLQATAKLEFWETYENSNDMARIFAEANEALRKEMGLDTLKKTGSSDAPKDTTNTANTATADSTDVAAATDTSASSLLSKTDEEKKDSLSLEEQRAQNPLYAILGQSQQSGVTIGFINGNDTAKLNEYLKKPLVKAVFPPDMKLVYSAKPNNDPENPNIYTVFAIKSRFGSNFKAPLEGDVVIDARPDFDANQQMVVSMTMNAEGASLWRKLTAENVKKSIAIVLDNMVYSAPVVQQEIAGGRSQITGNFSVTEAEDLANILKSGKLPAPARIIEEEVVGPTLGKESIRSGLFSLVLGLLAVIVFMVFYYSNAGIFANLALLANLFFIMGILASMGAVLTLPGMAGIVLTMGMAIDANVIIFERIREELARGSSMRKAISEGYSKSYSAIIDGNLTTLITGIILFYYGLGPVLGFATVLIVGILTSMFTAILLSRLVIDWFVGRGNVVSYSTSYTANAFKNINFDFLGKRKLAYYISGAMIAVSLLSIIFKGFEYGVDFEGGRTYVVRFSQAVPAPEIRQALATVYGKEPMVRTYGSSNQFKITTSYMIENNDPGMDNQVAAKLHEGLAKYENNISLEDFTSKVIVSSQKVGPTIADDIKRGAVWAGIFGLLGIFLYIFFRFRRWQYGAGAILATSHDAIAVLGVFSIFAGILPFSLEIDQAFIAAILTVIGYSVNDTVVVFDRIREYLGLNPKAKFDETVNAAINDTLSRTVMTSFATLLTVLVLFIFGGDTIRGFSFALLVGIIVGTYSSIFIAAPAMADLSKIEAERRERKAAEAEEAAAKKTTATKAEKKA